MAVPSGRARMPRAERTSLDATLKDDEVLLHLVPEETPVLSGGAVGKHREAVSARQTQCCAATAAADGFFHDEVHSCVYE